MVTQIDYLKNAILKFKELLIEKDTYELSNIIIFNNIEDKSSRKQYVKDKRYSY